MFINGHTRYNIHFKYAFNLKHLQIQIEYKGFDKRWIGHEVYDLLTSLVRPRLGNEPKLGENPLKEQWKLNLITLVLTQNYSCANV